MLDIGLMSVRHIPEVMDIEHRAYPWPWTEGMFLESLRSGHLCYVGQLQNRLVAYCVSYVAVQECHILNICVDPDVQSQGCGLQMLNHTLKAAHDLGAEESFLEVRPSNPAAIKLYEKRGYEYVGTRKNYYPAGDQREDALVYKLKLGAIAGK